MRQASHRGAAPAEAEIAESPTTEDGERGGVVFAITREDSRFSAALAAREGQGSFTALLRHDAAGFVRFMRTLLTVIEDDLGCRNYHLRVVPAPAPSDKPVFQCKRGQLPPPLDGAALMECVERAGFYIVVFGDNARQGAPADAESLLDLDAPIDYNDKSGKCVRVGITPRDLVVVEGDTTRCLLDAQGRPVYIVVFKRFVRYQTECSDTELLELWDLGLRAIEHANGPQEADLFSNMRLNAGTFQNVSHLHLKVWMDEERFNSNWAGHPGHEVLQKWRRKNRDERRAAGSSTGNHSISSYEGSTRQLQASKF